MNVIKRLESSIILDLEGSQILGLNIGLTNRGTVGTEFSEIRRESGFILNGDTVEEFNLPEITEIDNKIVLYSKTLNCGVKPLFDSDNDIKTIGEIIRFFSILKAKGISLTPYSNNLIYKTDNGDLLMMPPSIINYINDRASLAKKLSDQSIYIHPDLKSERSLLFSIGILLYEHTTDGYPIVYSDVEDLRDKMRRKVIIKPRWKNIRLNDEVCHLIDNLLDSDVEISLEETMGKMEPILKDGIFREDGDLIQEAILYEKLKTKMLNSEIWRHRFIKYKGLLIGVGIGLIILIAFFGSIISNALKPPKTVGFSRLQVVETYFAAFQTLDPELIDDVLAKGVNKNDSNEISTLYVTTKMRTQNDPSAVMLSPAEWLKLDDEKRAVTDVYGIYNLKIEPLSETTFNVHYEKWYTQAANEDISAEYVMEVHKLVMNEIFTLTKTEYSYEISNIETVTERSEKVW